MERERERKIYIQAISRGHVHFLVETSFVDTSRDRKCYLRRIVYEVEVSSEKGEEEEGIISFLFEEVHT